MPKGPVSKEGWNIFQRGLRKKMGEEDQTENESSLVDDEDEQKKKDRFNKLKAYLSTGSNG